MYYMENRILKLILPAVVMLLSCLAAGQGIRGTVKDRSGNILPYTHVFSPQLKKGTTSNAEGVYSLILPAGT